MQETSDKRVQRRVRGPWKVTW